VPHGNHVPARANDEESVDVPGHTGKGGPTLGTNPRPTRTELFEAKDEGVGRETVAPHKHQFRSRNHGDRPKAWDR
jgi:hypothetical protein